jgi:8-oxo-dGTP diphosphatase
MIKYVTGFMFDHALERVALIRKTKPAWQAGKLNGIGGKIDPGETPEEAMHREFFEETECSALTWRHFLNMTGARDGFSVDFFFTIGDVKALKSPEEEKVEIVEVQHIHPLRSDMIENLPWLIPLALDCLTDGRPHFVSVQYGADVDNAQALG